MKKKPMWDRNDSRIIVMGAFAFCWIAMAVRPFSDHAPITLLGSGFIWILFLSSHGLMGRRGWILMNKGFVSDDIV